MINISCYSAIKLIEPNIKMIQVSKIKQWIKNNGIKIDFHIFRRFFLRDFMVRKTRKVLQLIAEESSTLILLVMSSDFL